MMFEFQKLPWSGVIFSVQPRIRLLRSYDQRSHSYQGYVLRVRDGEQHTIVAVGNVAHEKYQFQVGMRVSGVGVPVADPRMETASLYKASGIFVEAEGRPQAEAPPPPFHGIPPDLPTYRQRGHRRLDPTTYETKCSDCIWGCRMPVEMTIDQWDQSKKKYRFETFCYGPLSCPIYHKGAARVVPGRKGMSWTERDWVDEEATSHRAPDE